MVKCHEIVCTPNNLHITNVVAKRIHDKIHKLMVYCSTYDVTVWVSHGKEQVVSMQLVQHNSYLTSTCMMQLQQVLFKNNFTETGGTV